MLKAKTIISNGEIFFANYPRSKFQVVFGMLDESEKWSTEGKKSDFNLWWKNYCSKFPIMSDHEFSQIIYNLDFLFPKKKQTALEDFLDDLYIFSKTK